MADDKFKLPGSSYEELTKIIKAYGEMSGPAGPSEVAGLIGVHETIVSRNNGFLLGAGIVEGGNKKAISSAGLRLARALDHSMVEETTRAWRTIVEESEFLARLVTAVRIRDGMEEGNLQAHVAYTAGQPNKGTTKTGSATVTQILKVSGLLTEEDGKLVARAPDDGDEGTDWEGELGATAVRRVPHDAESAAEPEPRDQSRGPSARPRPVPGESAPAFSIQVRVAVECSVEDLPKLRDELVALAAALPSDLEVDVADPDDAD